MEQIFIKAINDHSYRINPGITSDLALAVRWVLQIQQRFYRYRCSKALELLGLNEKCAHELITEEADISYDCLIQTVNDYIVAQPEIALDINVAQFGQLIGLSDLEARIFRFVLIARAWRSVFSDVRASRYYATQNDLYEVVAYCVNADANDVELALMPTSTLALCNLVTMERGTDLADQFRTLRVFDKLFANDCKPNELLLKFSYSVDEPSLGVDDFPHLKDAVSLMQRVLACGIEQRQTGINVLLYGPPGTGKTELASYLGHAVSDQVMGVSAFSGTDVHGAKSRLNALLMCQRLFSVSSGRVLIFDEADDVLPSQVGIAVGNSDALKMAINQLLETNATPCIWICNNIRHFDAAQLRRFTQIIKVETPPQPVRKKIAMNYLADTGVGESYISALSQDEAITPALLAQLARSYRAIEHADAGQKQRDFDLILNPFLQARLGRKRRETSGHGINPNYYNSDICMAALARQFIDTPDLRLCLYGPPGTGKTSFASYLSEQANMPLIKKTASDILGSFVGDTEKAIAMAFSEAEQNGAILLLDEVDTYIGRRDNAERHWQKSMANELLAQLDHYKGALVCTTNFMEVLDTAAIRRFDLKIFLDYLTSEQSNTLFLELVQEFSMSICASEIANVVPNLKLTPADFSVVRRKMRMLKLHDLTAKSVLDALVAETKFRSFQSKAIGFIK